MGEKSNYAFKRTAEQALGSNQVFAPQPLNAALDCMINFISRCVKGQGTLPEALFGVLFLGGTIVGAFLWALAALVPEAVRSSGFTLAINTSYCTFLLFSCIYIWRCAFNFRYWGVSVAVRVMTLLYAVGVVAFLHNAARGGPPLTSL